MAEFKLKLEVGDGGDNNRVWNKTLELDGGLNRDVPEEIAAAVMADLSMREKSAVYLSDFEPCTDLYDDSLTFSLPQMFSGDFERHMNPNEIWFEIQNTLLQSRILFSQARALKDFEEQASDSNTKYNAHFDKMDRFNLAVFLVTKVEDLICRAIFEALDANLLSVDMSEPEWERLVTWRRIKDGLKDRSANSRLTNMDDADYKRLLDTFLSFSNPAYVGEFRKYRDSVTHRVTPSVDYPELYTEIEDRSWQVRTDAQGRIQSATKAVGTRSKTAKFQFKDLYALASRTYAHYVKQLCALKAAIAVLP